MTDLTQEQQEVYDKILKGESLFLTGPGGVGKSYLLKKVSDHLRLFLRGERGIFHDADPGIWLEERRGEA